MANHKIPWRHHFIELLVVIIGISIAVGVDKYNERRKEAGEMIIALSSMADDLERDVNTFDNGQIPNNQERVDELDYIIDKLRNGETQADSLGRYIQRSLGSANSRLTTATYETMKASGRLDDVPNPELKKQIVAHYEGNYKQSDYLSNSNIDYSQQLRDYIVRNSTALIDGNFADKKLLSDPTFRSMLVVWRGMIRFKVREYQRMSRSSAQLLEAIKNEIE